MSASGSTSCAEEVFVAEALSLSRSPDAHHGWEKFRLDCHEAEQRHRFKYPITGSIELAETFSNYKRIIIENQGLYEEISDRVKFTTTITGSVTPSINLTAHTGRVIDGNLVLKEGRTDVHQLKITFTPPRTVDQIANAKQDKVKSEKLAELQRKVKLKELEVENAIPKRVIIIGPDGKPVTSIGSGDQPAAATSAEQLKQEQIARDETQRRLNAELTRLRRDAARALQQSEGRSNEQRAVDQFLRNKTLEKLEKLDELVK